MLGRLRVHYAARDIVSAVTGIPGALQAIERLLHLTRLVFTLFDQALRLNLIDASCGQRTYSLLLCSGAHALAEHGWLIHHI